MMNTIVSMAMPGCVHNGEQGSVMSCLVDVAELHMNKNGSRPVTDGTPNRNGRDNLGLV
jgi:hypothetical protein